MKFKVYAALSEDINNGWVWLPERVVASRSVVKITNTNSPKSVICEALNIGPNFLKRYNKRGRYTIEKNETAIVLNEWYRKKLGINKTQEICEFQVDLKDGFWGHISASLNHPQIVVRLATKLGILSVILGFIGLIGLFR